jgi:long-subunit fatty acid transport protein
MNRNKIFKSILITLTFVLLICSSATLIAQHRGDNLSFQGLTYKDNLSTKASAMGSAYTAVAGDISSLFYNSAGLARVDNFQITLNINQSNRNWRENQNWNTDRQFTNLPIYLEGLYIPLRENSGRWDYEIYKDSIDYIVNNPQLGVDSYDEAAADWKNTLNKFGFKNLAVAVPFYLGERKFVAAASYLSNNINDFDRNETFLSPTLTSYDYEEFIKVVNGIDTLNVKWNRYLRQRTGSMNNIIAGLSSEVFENVMVGIGVNVQIGQSDDYQSLVRFGDFHLIDAQKFKFYFVDTSTVISGTSDYNSASFNIGAIVELGKLKLGLKIDLPYSLSRDWNYTVQQIGDSTTTTETTSGTDEVQLPAIYNFGLSFQPVNNFLISFNYEYAPYSNAEFSFADGDTTFRHWVDQNSLGIGMEYKMFDFLSLLAGFRSIPEVFVPDGAAIKDKGPGSDSYNFGISVNTFIGRFDLAYEYRKLKYYDQYYSNTNYVFESNSSLMFGFTYLFE